MRTKERKKLAQKIAQCEYIIQTSTDKDEIKRAEYQVMELSGCVHSLDDMQAIDDLVQDLLKPMLDKEKIF